MTAASFWDMKSQGLEHFWRLDADDPQHRIERTSQAANIAHTLFDLAIEQCRSKEFTPDSDEAWVVIETAGQLASDLTFPTWIANGMDEGSKGQDEQASAIRKQFRLTYDVEPRFLIDEARRGHQLHIDREYFESAVGGYLSSEFRADQLDRLLMFTVIDMEVSAFFRAVYGKYLLTGASPIEVHRALKSPVASWLSARVKDTVYVLSIWVSAWVLSEYFGVLPGSWLETIVIVTLGYWVVNAVVSLVLLPFAVARYRPNKQKLDNALEKLPDSMMGVYSERWTEGPISVGRLRKLLEDASEAGASWPSALWPLLEDIEARGRRYI